MPLMDFDRDGIVEIPALSKGAVYSEPRAMSNGDYNPSVSYTHLVLNADADSFDQMIANRLEPEIYSLHSLGAFAGAVVHAGESRYPIHILSLIHI